MMITQAQLKEKLHYSADTGIFIWLKSSSHCVFVGKVAGYRRTNGYIRIHVEGKSMYAHRLAFLYMTGEIPKVVDHINRNKSDNRWGNIRESNHFKNNWNKVTNNSFIGVAKRGDKWRAYSSKINGKEKHLGYFCTHLAACYARHINDINFNQQEKVE